MAEAPSPPPPRKPAGPLRWILLGCGVLTGLFILGMGGCAGIFYFIYKGTDPVAEVGADYLRKAPQVQEVFGSPVDVKRHKFGWNVHVADDGGNARITYDVRGPGLAVPGEAVVWLIKSAGTWSVSGVRVSTKAGNTLEIGKPPSERHRIDWDD